MTAAAAGTSVRSAATRWPCCHSVATTWAIISRTGSKCAATSNICPRVSCELVPQNEHGKFLWRLRRNMRVLKWIVQRCQMGAHAIETSIGWKCGISGPRHARLGERLAAEKFAEVQKIDTAEWHRELVMQDELFIKLYSHLPKELVFQRELLVARL